VHDTLRRGPNPALNRATPRALVEALSHPNGWWRDTAQQLLVQRHDKAAVEPLKKLATESAAPRTRLHALWTLDGMDSLDAAGVTRALGDPSRDVRVSAIRLSERWLREGNGAMLTAVLALMPDPDWAVREQLAASLGELPQGRKRPRWRASSSVRERPGGDGRGVERSEGQRIGRAGDAAARDRRNPAARDGDHDARGDDRVERAGRADSALFDAVAETPRPAWQRSALLRGAEVTLLSVDAITGPRRGRGRGAAPADARRARPVPAAAPARAGPPRFPSARGAADPSLQEGNAQGGAPAAGRGGRGRGAARPALKLTREPRHRGTRRERRRPVLARDGCPRAFGMAGKPGMAAPAAPLTPEEQTRFEAGRTVYQNLCQACHQPDGRGMEKLAPPLIGSEFRPRSVAHDPIRIVLNGKEGSVALMPPLGGLLSDEQIAAVLTYIRREWGHTASPIDAAAVAQARKDTAGRTRPWTNDELATLMRGGR
jgi:mono/diheme cytochrome c family protein